MGRGRRSCRARRPGCGPAERCLDVTSASPLYVNFHYTCTFLADGAVLTSDSTLRFRGRDETTASLDARGHQVLDVREASDRPGRELVFITQRTT
jgi:hypothetical protein